MKYLIAIVFLCCVYSQSIAQVTFVEDSAVTSLMNRFKSHHSEQLTIKAWRIQVVTTTDRRKMEEDIARLSTNYPELKYFWKHASPYYQLKVGAFEEKKDLQNLLLTLKRDFPSAIPVMDEIEKSELL
jgi:hypothetical protein